MIGRLIRKIKNSVIEYQKAKPRPLNVLNVTLAPSELLKYRRALITGGTSGIGFEIARAFLNAGANVIITGRSQDRLDTAAKLLNSPGRLTTRLLDIRNTNAIEEVIPSVFAEFNGIDILVNNAGIGGCEFPNISEENFDNVIATNLRGPLFCAQMFAKQFVAYGLENGNILNIASSSSLRPANSPYILSKWGIRALTLGLAKSLAPYNITVNGIAPGPTATPMLIRPGDPIQLKTSALGRFILPEEIANMAVVLVSPIGRSVIGSIVYMTGGAGVITFDDVNYSIKI